MAIKAMPNLKELHMLIGSWRSMEIYAALNPRLRKLSLLGIDFGSVKALEQLEELEVEIFSENFMSIQDLPSTLKSLILRPHYPSQVLQFVSRPEIIFPSLTFLQSKTLFKFENLDSFNLPPTLTSLSALGLVLPPEDSVLDCLADDMTELKDNATAMRILRISLLPHLQRLQLASKSGFNIDWNTNHSRECLEGCFQSRSIRIILLTGRSIVRPFLTFHLVSLVSYSILMLTTLLSNYCLELSTPCPFWEAD
jgi:hypothetical protein